jgi:hypothetical protein
MPGKLVGLAALNVNLPVLLQMAYAGTGMLDLPGNRKILQVKNKAAFGLHKDTSFYQYAYCYDISLPPVSPGELGKYMQQDMGRFFRLGVKKEKRILPCYVIMRGKNYPRTFRESALEEIEYESGSLRKYLKQVKLCELVKFFDLRLSKPLLNETGLPPDSRFNIDLPFDLKNEAAMLQALRKAGFIISKIASRMEVTVIYDN